MLLVQPFYYAEEFEITCDVWLQDIDRTCDWFRESFSDFVYVVNSLQRATVPQPLHVCMTLCLHCCLWLYVTWLLTVTQPLHVCMTLCLHCCLWLYVTWLLTVPQPLHVCMTLCFHCRDRIVGNKSYRDIVLRYVEYREVACMELNGGYTAAGSVPSICCSAAV